MTAAGPAQLTATHLVRRRPQVGTGTPGTVVPAEILRQIAGEGTAGGRSVAGGGAARPAKGGRRGTNARVRLTIRLDAERHLRLKLTAAHLNLHVQDVMVAALDKYLEQMGPDVLSGRCACLSGPPSR